MADEVREMPARFNKCEARSRVDFIDNRPLSDPRRAIVTRTMNRALEAR